MEQSKQFQEILSLGKALVNLFSEHDRTDLTTAWMAHYLAELMREVENERDTVKKKALQKECSKIILDLWSTRNKFPASIRPLSGLSHVVAIIKALQDEKSDDLYFRRFRDHESDSNWGNYIYSLRNAIEDSLKITLSAAITKQVLDSEKKWIKHNTFLDENERKIIQFLDEQLDKDDVIIKIVDSTKDETNKARKQPDKMTRVFDKLRELLAKQTAALDRLEESVLKPKNKSTKSKRPRRTKHMP